MVSIDSRSFPSKLLEQKTTERLAYFQSITVPPSKAADGSSKLAAQY